MTEFTFKDTQNFLQNIKILHDIIQDSVQEKLHSSRILYEIIQVRQPDGAQ